MKGQVSFVENINAQGGQVGWSAGHILNAGRYFGPFYPPLEVAKTASQAQPVASTARGVVACKL
jgi:hypothetical protein